MRKFLSLILTLVISNTSLAVCDKKVTLLNENQTSPCTGYLFTPQAEQELRTKLVDLDYYVALSTSLSKINDLQKKALDISVEQKDLLQKDLAATQQELQTRKNYDYLYYGAGILTSILVMFAVRQ
jgi:hypothetical protein